MFQLNEILERTIALHHHLCPRQVLGVRIGMLAAELLTLELPQSDKRLYTFVETDGCFSDGVAVATGCTLGHRTMRLMDYGKVAATFVDTATNRALRIWPHPQSRRRAVDLYPDESSHWRAQLEAYQELSADELFQWIWVTPTVSMAELISQPGLRVTCSKCGEEILNAREVIIDGQPVCRACAGTPYYQPLG